MSDQKQNYFQNTGQQGNVNPNMPPQQMQQPGQFNYGYPQQMPPNQGMIPTQQTQMHQQMPQQYYTGSPAPQGSVYQGAGMPNVPMGQQPQNYGQYPGAPNQPMGQQPQNFGQYPGQQPINYNQYPGMPNQQMQQQTPGSGVVNPQNQLGTTDKTKKRKYVHVGPFVPTLKAKSGISPNVDAEALFKAFKGIGCNEKAVTEILTHRYVADRALVLQAYNEKYPKKLIERLKSELYEPMETLMVSLVHFDSEKDAFFLRKATKAVGTNEDGIIEILCTKPSQRIESIKASYQNLYGKSLESQLKSATPGSLFKILQTLLNTPRSNETTVDREKAQSDAASLSSKSAVLGSPPESLIHLFCTNSFSQLLAMFGCYFALNQKTIYNHLKKYEQGGNTRALMAIYLFATNPLHFYSKRLRNAILKQNTIDLIRIISTKCEHDLASIFQDYRFVYGSDPMADIKTHFAAMAATNFMTALFSLMGA